MKLNEKIAYYRRKRGYSQQALADMMGVSRQSVSKWETGESLPEVTKLPQLAALFGVTTDFLLSAESPADADEPPKAEKSAEAEAPAPDFHASASAAEPGDFARAVPSAMDAFLDRLPHFLRKLIRLYGWVAGIRIAISGVMCMVFALLGGLIVSGVNQSVRDWDPIGIGTEKAQYFNADGSVMQNVPQALRDYVEGTTPPESSWTLSFKNAPNPFTPLLIGVGIIGLLLLLGGIALAIYLKPHFPSGTNPHA